MENIKLNTVIDGSIKIDDAITKSQLFYIIQEAVTNAIKHSKAETISIVLQKENGYAKLTIKDDGIGIANSDVSDWGIGMKIMQYRARMIKGTIDFYSVEGKGAEVICKFEI